MNHPFPKVFFFHIKDNQAKIRCICTQVQDSIEKGKKVLITVPNQEAASYIDLLLWRFPEESFLPHLVMSKPTKEWIAITITDQNVNGATRLLNLCPMISPLHMQFEEIYELYDETHLQKATISQKKLEEYQSRGISPKKIALV